MKTVFTFVKYNERLLADKEKLSKKEREHLFLRTRIQIPYIGSLKKRRR